MGIYKRKFDLSQEGFQAITENSYVNISACRFNSKNLDQNKSYVNINAYIKSEDLNVLEKDKTQLLPNFDLYNNDYDNDYGCVEVGNPEINYHVLDFRKNRLKKSTRYMTTSINISQLNNNENIHTTNGTWRRRSLTPDSIDYNSKFHQIIYADLMIRNCDDNRLSKNLKNHSEPIEYTEIDFTQTQALVEMDNELENLKSSKLWHKSCRLKLQRIVKIYQRLKKAFSGTKTKSEAIT